MAQPGGPQSEPLPNHSTALSDAGGSKSNSSSPRQKAMSKLLGRQQNGNPSPPEESPPAQGSRKVDDGADERSGREEERDSVKSGLLKRISKSVVPGLPRTQTLKRQESEKRNHLTPTEITMAERRAVSADRRSHVTHYTTMSQDRTHPRASAPGLLASFQDRPISVHEGCPPTPPLSERPDEPSERPGQKIDRWFSERDGDLGVPDDELDVQDQPHDSDAFSMTSQMNMIQAELETKWILNLSMHFKDKSRREKFFVTYREHPHDWRRVTISLDYRDAPPGSLEGDLLQTKYQRDKSAKIYEAIRESLHDIQFYDTVTNLKLETLDGRLHVHVMEDATEMISYPPVSQVVHLGCKRIRESDLVFDSHLSGYVYKVIADGRTLIKKEIPSHDTIDEFLYEINALNSLSYSSSVIQFYGVVVDEYDENIKGLLINYANGGALIDIIYDNCKESMSGLPWGMKERWARQIVQGLADIHESGFVQGDFTLSNIVIDENDDAKIIDINRRGCPVGWEPPEASPLLSSGMRISMYIGVKSDLYQLGMVLWALAMEEDEPEHMERPLFLGQDARVPWWYREITETCLNPDPRKRLSAARLVEKFPRDEHDDLRISVDDGYSIRSYDVDELAKSYPQMQSLHPARTWSHSSLPSRGRSLPSPLPSVDGRSRSPPWWHDNAGWTTSRNIRPSYSDVETDDTDYPPTHHRTQTPTGQNLIPCDDEQMTPRANGQMSEEMGLNGILASGGVTDSVPRSAPRSLATKESIMSLTASSVRSARSARVDGSVFDDTPTPRVGTFGQLQVDDVIVSNAGSTSPAAKRQKSEDRRESTKSDMACLVMDKNEDGPAVTNGSSTEDKSSSREALAEVSVNIQRSTGTTPASDSDSIPLTDVYVFGCRGGGEVRLDTRSNSPVKYETSSTVSIDLEPQVEEQEAPKPAEGEMISESEKAESEAQSEDTSKTPVNSHSSTTLVERETDQLVKTEVLPAPEPQESTSSAGTPARQSTEKDDQKHGSEDEHVLDSATNSTASTTPTKNIGHEVQPHIHAILPTDESHNDLKQIFWPHDPHHRPETPPMMYRTAPTSPIRSLDGMQGMDFIQPLDLTPLREITGEKGITSPILSVSTMSPGDAHWTTGPQTSDSKSFSSGYASTPRLTDPNGSQNSLADSLLGIGTSCLMPGHFDTELNFDDDDHDLMTPAKVQTITTGSRI